MNRHFIYLLLFFVFLLGGCFEYKAPLNREVEVVNSVLKSIDQSNDKKKMAREGIAKLEKFLEEHPKTKSHREIHLHMMGVVFKYLSKDSDIFLRVCEEFLAKYPKDSRTPNCLFRVGIKYYEIGKMKKALSKFDHLISSFARHPKSKMAIYWKAIVLFETLDYKKCSQTCENFVKKWPKSKEVKSIQILLKKSNFALEWKGKSVPSFVRKDIFGRFVRTATWKQNVILLVFWKPTSKGIQRMRSLDKLQEKFGGKNFRIVAVAIMRQATKEIAIQTLLELLPFSMKKWIHLYTLHGFSSVLVKGYKITKTPVVFLVNQKGNIAGVGLWGKPLERVVSNLVE